MTQRRRTNQRTEADRLFSKIVRSEGRCEASRWHPAPGPQACGGNLQCAHGFSRRYLATRFERINGFCLCAAHHVWFTHHPLEWDSWLREMWGSAVYDELRRKALAGGRPDYKTLIPKLRAELEAMV